MKCSSQPSLPPDDAYGEVTTTDKGGSASSGGKKTCSKCHVEKATESFYRRSDAKDGRMGVCRRCYLANIAARNARKAAASRWHWMKRYA